ncbi:MAG TPA: surface-adhesin E family protein [Candidatus Manganitrophaceae bacterium]|nr:surface-adhesin E family protein [Candidatus Manganitrophaceae bacterium]
MKKIILWLLFLFLLFPGPYQNAGAAEWTPFVEDQAFKHFYDKQSIAHLKNGIVRVAIKIDPKGKEGRDFLLKVRERIGLSLDGYENYGFSLDVMEIDCPNKRKRILQSDDYNKKGEQLDTVSSPNPKWVEINPDSVHGLYHKVFCK